MCEHCGCQDFGPVRELHRDHLAILDVCVRLADALDAGDPAALRTEREALAALLSQHERREETGLYREIGGSAPEYVAALIAEHGEVGHLLRSPADDREGEEPLRRGIARLRQHIFTEEQDLFPFALQTLSPAQWDSVEDVQSANSRREGP